MKKHIAKLFAAMLVIVMVIGVITPAFAAEKSFASENGITIETSLEDGSLQKGKKKTFDVWARDDSGAKAQSSATLNGEPVKANWDDIDKTSFTLLFTKEGDNTVVVTASSDAQTATATFHITYQKAAAGDIIGYATWSVEAFTIGQGYIVEPVRVPIKEGENSAVALIGANAQIKYGKGTSSSDSILGKSGFNFECTGKVASGFYFAAIKDGNKKLNIPDDVSTTVPLVLKSALNENNCSTWLDSSDGANFLSEFTFSQGSGWMYSVNNVFPNVGLSDTYLSDGDVVRVQFTLWYGSDIGGSSAMGGGSSTGFYNTADKGKLTALTAQINSGNKKKLLTNAKIKAAYDSAYDVLQQLDTDQAAADSAYIELSEAMNLTPLESISLNKTNLSLPKGASANLTVFYSPANTTDSKTVTWKSSDNGVASVSKGRVTAVGAGSAVITAKVGSCTAECEVTVKGSNMIEGSTKAVSTKDEATNVTVDASVGVVPENTHVIVQPVTTDSPDDYKIVETALAGVAKKFTAYQILLESDDIIIQPNGKVKVRLPIPEGYDRTRLAVIKVHPDGTTKTFNVTLDGNTLTFETDSFSLYTIVEKTDAAMAQSASSVSAVISSAPVASHSSTQADNHSSGTNPKTGENFPFEATASLTAISLLMFITLSFRSKQQTN